MLEIRGQAIADYFISEVLEQQSPELVQFMLDTSVLTGALTADVCAAVTGRQDAAALLHAIETGHLFLVALDDERTSFRYPQLVRQVLRAELRARDRARGQALQVRAAEWFEAAGEARRAAYHHLAAQQADRALALLQDQVVPDFPRGPTAPEPLVLSMVDPSMLLQTPERMLGLASHLVLWGDTARGGEYLDLLDRAGVNPADSRLAARLAAFQSFRYGMAGAAGKGRADGPGRTGNPGAHAAHRRMESRRPADPHPRDPYLGDFPAASARQPRLWRHPRSPNRSSS